MANIFFQQRKRIVYLLVLVVFIATALLVWFIIQRDVFMKDPVAEKETQILRRPEIDFSVLRSPQFKELRPLEQVPPLKEEAGRENPFIPY